MSTEPERNIEKTLKSYAKKRKEEAGAPLEMHPATRRLLQSEVARTFPKEARRSGWLNVFSGFWPRLALGGSIFIVLGIGIWALVSESPKQKVGNELALNRERELRDTERVQLAPSRKLDLGIPQKNQAVLSQEPVPATPPAPVAAPAPSAEAKYYSYQKEQLWTTNSFAATDGVKNAIQLAKKAERLSDDAYHVRPISPSSQPTPTTRSRSEETVNKTEAAAIPQEAKPAAPSLAGAAASTRPDSPLAQQYGTVVLSASSGNGPTSGVAFGGPLTLNSNFTANGGATQNGLAVWSAAGVPAGASLLSADTYQSSTQTFTRRAGAEFDLAQDKVTTGSPALLNTFSFVQTGDQLRVFDDDGSVYYGYVEGEDISKAVLKSSENRAAKQTPALAEAKSWGSGASSDRSKDTPSKRQFFRVSGTNLTLNEPILFTGNIILTNNATTQTLNFVGGSLLGSSARKPGATGTNGQSGTNFQATIPTLEGKVVIGGTNQIPIKAFRVAPGK
jgi:hypothetical protein